MGVALKGDVGINPHIHVIGNPPFGRQSSLAIKFIKKAAEFSETISFILPKSFKKESLKKHFPLQFHLTLEHDLPHNSFTVDGKPHDVPCVFQIWHRRTIPREVPLKLTPQNFQFVKKTEHPDLSFRRVGVNAGTIERDTDLISTKSEQSHYFIKFNEPISSQLYEQLAKLNYGGKDNTVGPRSISKQELIKEFNKVIGGDLSPGVEDQ